MGLKRCRPAGSEAVDIVWSFQALSSFVLKRAGMAKLNLLAEGSDHQGGRTPTRRLPITRQCTRQWPAADHEQDLRPGQALAIAAISAITLAAIAACAGSSRD